VKPGDLVYATFHLGRPRTERGLGLIAKVEPGEGVAQGEQVYRIFWVDEDEPAWYYEHEVESVRAPR